MSRDKFEAARRAILAAARTMSPTVTVRYLRGVVIPSQGRALCLFETPDAQSVRDVNVEAGVPFESVNEAVDLAIESHERTRT